MTRTYTLRRRAEQQADTRLRITEAAMNLHGEVGPAATTVSMIAERAGVQRHTVYAHFPDERAILRACSTLHLERQPLPDPEKWRAIADPRERLRTGLSELYRWYEANAGVVGSVLRDAEFHAPTQETAKKGFIPYFRACAEALGAGLDPHQRAMVGVAVSFHTWRTLARVQGLGSDAAADTMAKAIGCASASRSRRNAR
jgi:AcrR family transcriptional regulator